MMCVLIPWRGKYNMIFEKLGIFELGKLLAETHIDTSLYLTRVILFLHKLRYVRCR